MYMYNSRALHVCMCPVSAPRGACDRAMANGEENPDLSPAPAPESAEGKRRSRWGAKSEDAEPAEAAAGQQARKRSRWGNKPQPAADPVTLAVQLGIPLATLQQMTAEQQQILPSIKSKIDDIDLQCARHPPRSSGSRVVERAPIHRVVERARAAPSVEAHSPRPHQAEAPRLRHQRYPAGAALAGARAHLRQERPASEQPRGTQTAEAGAGAGPAD